VSETPGQREQLASISEDDAADLVSTRGGAAYVLDLLARTARPGCGAAPLLRALGQLAKSGEDARYLGREHWFEGTLLVEIVALGGGITVDLMTETGGGIGNGSREPLFQRLYFGVPLDELRWMVERVPELAGPLRIRPSRSRFGVLMLSAAYPSPTSSARNGSALSADDTSKIVVSPESLIDPDSTSPVPALMAELAVLSRSSQLDPREL
jgi:hypothetical protein